MMVFSFQNKYNSEGTHFHCDNAGESINFQKKFEAKNMFFDFEFTAPDTPQQNSRVERKYSTLYGKVRAITNSAQLPLSLKQRLWAQTASSFPQLENILVSEQQTKAPSEMFDNWSKSSIGEEFKNFWGIGNCLQCSPS
jgi:hypothetical protein